MPDKSIFTFKCANNLNHYYAKVKRRKTAQTAHSIFSAKTLNVRQNQRRFFIAVNFRNFMPPGNRTNRSRSLRPNPPRSKNVNLQRPENDPAPEIYFCVKNALQNRTSRILMQGLGKKSIVFESKSNGFACVNKKLTFA
jgi:hypothetical protein